MTIDPRARTLVGADSSSYMTTTYSKKFAEAETIEFWVRAYTPNVLTGTVITIITQPGHFDFALNFISGYNAGTVTFTIHGATDEIVTSQPFTADYLSGWVHVAGVIGLNEIKSFVMLDESAPVIATNTISSLAGYSSSSLVFEAVPSAPGSAHFVLGIREFKIWGKYKTPGELRGLRFARPSAHEPGLSFYLPMDESSGPILVERVSESAVVVDANYWYDQADDRVNAYGGSSQQVRDNIALAMRNQGELRFNISGGSHTYNEMTFMLWLRMTPSSQILIQWSGYYIFTMKVDLTATTTTTFKYADYKTTPRSSPIPAGTWNSIAFVRGSSSRKFYVNGVSKTFDDLSVCYRHGGISW